MFRAFGRRVAGMDKRTRYLAQVVALAAVYYGAAKLGLELAFETASVTAVWPPTGIALAALVLGGYRLWPGVALGAFLANSGTGIPVYAVLGITLGNTLEAVAGTYLLRRFGDFRPSLERVRDVLALVAGGAIVSTMISATIGVSSLLAADEIAGGEFGSVWRTWWLGDMGGDLVVAPALLVGATLWPFRPMRGRLREATALALITAGVAAFVFTRDTNLVFLVFPALIWGCLRFWRLGAVATILLVASIAIPLTESDLGPFSGNPDERLLLAQAFLGVASITALVLAAAVTERQRVEDSLAHIASTLQESLLPHPPEIPGVELAVDFRPAGERQLVGGDFYDWFRNDDGSWAVTIGDVVGKGAPAAAIAGLARHTIRAAAIREMRPSRILQLLNDAVMRQSPGQICTVAYARIELDRVGGGSRVTLCVAGHPPPLVLRSDGSVEPVGRGMLLGVSAAPGLDDHRVDLAPGDALVLHTDGLTDAYPSRVVSEEELSVALRSCAGLSAGGIVQGLESAVLPGDDSVEPRDDLVLLALRLPSHDRREPEAWLRASRGPAGAREPV